ncbi:hypothetical protein BGX26_001069 [Mortierella sp. AD094]|nr:hypothetical protein BGX26_001069 [Mortierella sp. AD094]
MTYTHVQSTYLSNGTRQTVITFGQPQQPQFIPYHQPVYPVIAPHTFIPPHNPYTPPHNPYIPPHNPYIPPHNPYVPPQNSYPVVQPPPQTPYHAPHNPYLTPQTPQRPNSAQGYFTPQHTGSEAPPPSYSSHTRSRSSSNAYGDKKSNDCEKKDKDFQKGYSTKRFTKAHEDIPRVFVIAPPLEDPFIKGTYKPFRILVPCEAPGATYGPKDAVHITAHGGYTIKNPRDFLHDHQGVIDNLCTVATYLYSGASIAGRQYGIQGLPDDLVGAAANSLQRTIRNRSHINRIGIDDPSTYYSIQHAVDNHQREAMRALLRAATASSMGASITGDLKGIVFEGGRTMWVCDECYDKMLQDERIAPEQHTLLSEYAVLTKRDPTVNAVLRNYASVKILTDTLNNSSKTQVINIRIFPDYFEEPGRRQGARFYSILNQFNDLGNAIKDRKNLIHLEIQGNSQIGDVYTGLQNILRCPKLQRLVIQGLPRFFQGPTISCESRSITHISLDGAFINNDSSAINLRALVESNKPLESLHILRAELTKNSINVIVSTRSDSFQKRMEKITLLDLSHNNLDAEDVKKFLSMTVKSNHLKTLILLGNPRIGDAGCRDILSMLSAKNRILDVQIDHISPAMLRVIHSYSHRR